MSQTSAPKAAEAKTATKAEPPKPAPKPVEPLPTNVVELEHAVEVAAALAVKEYNKAIDILKKYVYYD